MNIEPSSEINDRPSSVTDKKSESSYSHSNCDTPTSQSQQRDTARDRDGGPRGSVTDGSSSQQHQPPSSQQQQSQPPPPPPPPNSDGKPWNYSNIDLMATGAFWHNYSG